MSNENAGRTTRANGSAPMGNTIAIVVTAIALVLGFLILRKVNDGDGGTTVGTVKPDNSSGVVTSDSTGVTASTSPPTTTTPPLVTAGTKVQVANASHQDGVARSMSAALGTKGWTMAEAVSASTKVEKSRVLYNADDPAAKDVAMSLGAFLGGIEVVVQGVPVPAGDGTWAAGTGVVLMLGDDYAGKTLDEIAGAPTTGTTTPPTVAGATTSTT